MRYMHVCNNYVIVIACSADPSYSACQNILQYCSIADDPIRDRLCCCESVVTSCQLIMPVEAVIVRHVCAFGRSIDSAGVAGICLILYPGLTVLIDPLSAAMKSRTLTKIFFRNCWVILVCQCITSPKCVTSLFSPLRGVDATWSFDCR